MNPTATPPEDSANSGGDLEAQERRDYKENWTPYHKSIAAQALKREDYPDDEEWGAVIGWWHHRVGHIPGPRPKPSKVFEICELGYPALKARKVPAPEVFLARIEVLRNELGS